MAEAAAGPARRQAIIQLRMDNMIEEYRRGRQQGWCPSCADCAPSAGLHESLTRCVNFTRFSLVCCAGAFNAMAPWALAAAEAATVLLIYFLLVPDALFTHTPLSSYRYNFDSSCEDVVVLSLLRFVVVLAAYLLGAGPQYQRPYLYTAMAAGAFSLPFALLKSVALRQSGLPHRQWLAHVAIYATHGGYSLAHMVAAQRVVSWARKRYEMGLLGFGYPWEEGEQTWLLAGQLRAGGLWGAEEAGEEVPVPNELHDVPAEKLADEDSQFLEDCQGLRVHYKMALPQGAVEPGDSAILLIHSFGGGTFSWRHIMQPLADACGLAVVAFDRPGFGLTSRPGVPPKTPLEDNPYSLKFQAVLTLKLAWQLDLQRVLLVGHEDGSLVALMASAMACREEQRFSFSPNRHPPPAPPPSPFLPCIPPPSPTITMAPSIQQSMDAAWSGGLAREGSRGFLLRLLRGEFSPSPTNGILSVPWPQQPQQPWRGRQQQQQHHHHHHLHQQRYLRRYSVDSSDWQEEGRGAWWMQQPGTHPAPTVQEDEEEEECPILPRSTDPSPPHSVASLPPGLHGCVDSPLHEASWGADAADGRQQAAWYGTQHAQSPWQLGSAPLASGHSSSRGGAQYKAGMSSAAASRFSADATLAEAAAHIPPAQQRMEQGQQVGASGGAAHPHGAGAGTLQPSYLVPGALASPFQGPLRSAVVMEASHSLPQTPKSGAAPLGTHHHDPEAASWHLPGWQLPLAVGLVMLHPDLSGKVAPRYARVLGNSRLGRRVLRTLLRTEVGEVSNRRAWCDDSRLTPDLLHVYKRSLQVVDWDKALIEVCRTPNQMHSVERARLLGVVAGCGLPVLVMTGERDHMSTPAAAAALSERLPGSRLAVLPGCGHLAHEERPATLLDFLAAFVSDVAHGQEAPPPAAAAGDARGA